MIRSGVPWTLAALLVAGCGEGAAGGDSGPRPDVPGDVEQAEIPGDPGLPPADPGTDPASEIPTGDLPVDIPDAGTDSPGEVLPEGFWARGPEFPLPPELAALAPGAFDRMSLFATRVEGPPERRPDVGHRGAFGTGNGHVFAQVGLADPLNTLHSLVGPTYERRPNFFGDFAVRLLAPGEPGPVPFDEEWAGRSLSAPVVVTRAIRDGMTLVTVDLGAPEGLADLPPSCWIRGLMVQSSGDREGWSLVVEATNEQAPLPGGRMRESGPAGDGRIRDLVSGLVGATNPQVEGRRSVLPLGSLSAGSSRWFLWVACASDRPASAPPPEDWPLRSSAAPEDLLAEALRLAAAGHQDWSGRTVQMDLPDPLVADFLEGMKMTLKVQTATTGASCPMSEYTRTWTRDNMGPVLALLAYGAFEDVAAILDYLEAAIRWSGDLRNSYDADLDPAGAPPAPDWASLGTLDGRVAAETPSYLVRMHTIHARQSGDLSRVASRVPLLRRCMMDQAFGPDDLLPFTGDETYRAAMNAALGVPDLDYPHHDRSWSLNSTLLWLGAARDLQEMLETMGESALAGDLRDRAERMAYRALPRFLLPDGCLAAFLDRDTESPSAPFEDASLQVTWSGWLDGDEPLAQTSLRCLEGRIRRAPGEWVTPLDPYWAGTMGAWEGIYTGMLPGYTLAAMTAIGHPEAQAAFDAVRLSLDTSGNLQEYLVFDDHSGVSLVYDPTGVIGDYTAKFRPWEGGIVAEAALRYLLGFAPDALRGTLSLRPHLPDAWPRMAFRGLRAGQSRFDVAVERGNTPGTFRVEIRRETGADPTPFAWTLRWDASLGLPAFRVDGSEVPDQEIRRLETLFGTTSALVSGGEIPLDGRPVVVEIVVQPGDPR
ncbi:hypothetical protein KBD49_14400 [Myxococcota bacterium]|nr:hypothetical protein [Myxococcota bacterium]